MSITRINTNPESMMAAAQLNNLSMNISKNIAHLSTGLRITTGADDPSGVALANKFRSQLSGIQTAMGNVQDTLSLFAHADASMNETSDMLRRMRDLAVKASNAAAYTATDTQNMDTEFQALMTEVTRRASAVTFNTKVLLNGTYSTQTIQAGPDNGPGFQITVSIQVPTGLSMTAAGLGISGVVISNSTAALSAIDFINSALNMISSTQATVGVTELKLQHVINDLSSQSVNMAAAQSRITDCDMAAEVAAFTKNQVLAQAATAMLAQANAQPQTVMSLLGLK